MASFFEKPEALAKLAALNPVPVDLPAATGGTARKEGKRTAAGTGASIGSARLGESFALAAQPAWLGDRLSVLSRIQERNAERLASLPKPAITVTLPDGKQLPGTAWVTSPSDIAGSISKGLQQAVVVASVRYSSREPGWSKAVTDADREDDGGAAAAAEWEVWDATRPLEGSCELKLVKFDEPAGKEVFWHSSAHILGEALESLFSAQLTHGPALDSGFFYDSFLGGNPMRPDMAAQLEKAFKSIA